VDEHLEQLYQDIILQHSKRPKNERVLDPCTSKAEGYNPLCGDQITVYLNESGGKIEDCSFEGHGCAISRASASIMTGLLRGLSPAQAQEKAAEVYRLLTTSQQPDVSLDTLGDLAALAGVRKFPARIKCATLAWHALEDALNSSSEGSKS
jgi:nitrogen fixation protein NifU and related proteins